MTAASPSLPVPAIGERLPDYLVTALDGAQVAAYAAASGDSNPIHLDEDAARAAGLPGTIVHGMLVMGQFEATLRAWRPECRIETMQSRFLRPLAVGGGLRIEGRVAKVETETPLRLIVRLMVRDGTGTPICVGDARIGL